MATPSTPNGIFSNPAVASAVDADLWGGILNSNFNIADTQTTTRAYDLNFADFILSRPKISDFGEVVASAASAANAITLDFSTAQHFKTTLSENITTVTLSNPSPANTVAGYIWFLKQGGSGSYTVTWPAAVVWPSGNAPVLTTTVGQTDRVTLVWDAGAAKYLASIVQNYTV